MLLKLCSGSIFLMICLAAFAPLITSESLNPIVENTERNHAPLDSDGKPLTEKDHEKRLEHHGQGHHLKLQMDMLQGNTDIVLNSTLIANGPDVFGRSYIDYVVDYEVSIWCPDEDRRSKNGLKPRVMPISKPYVKKMQNMTFYYFYHFKCVANRNFVCDTTDFDIESKKPRFASQMWIPTTSLKPIFVHNWDKYYVCEVATNRSVTVYTVEERLNDLNISINDYHSMEDSFNRKKNIQDVYLGEMWRKWRESEIDKNLEYRKLNNIRLYQGLEVNVNEERADKDLKILMSRLAETSVSRCAWSLFDFIRICAAFWLMVYVQEF